MSSFPQLSSEISFWNWFVWIREDELFLICSISLASPPVLFALMVAVLLISNFLRDATDGQSSLCFCKCRLGNRWRASWSHWGSIKVRLYFKSPCNLTYQNSCFSVWGAERERASFCCLLLRPRCFPLSSKSAHWNCQVFSCFHFPIFVSCC